MGISGKKVQNDGCCYFISAYPCNSDHPHVICPVLLAPGDFWKILPAQHWQSPQGSLVNLLTSYNMAWGPWDSQSSQSGLLGLMQMLPLAMNQRLFMGLCQHLSPKGYHASAWVTQIHISLSPGSLPLSCCLFFFWQTYSSVTFPQLPWWGWGNRLFLCSSLGIFKCWDWPTLPFQNGLFLFYSLGRDTCRHFVSCLPRLSCSSS